MLVGAGLLVLSAAPLAAQDAPQPSPEQSVSETPDEGADEDEILVVGQRERGAVIGDIPPENQLGPRDIRAYGATSVAELLQAIAPQTSSARGRDGGAPVVLLNGRRTSGFREVRDLPPEAILRVDILPEEVALSYGYRADQRVVNIVLRPRFRSTSLQLEGDLPTQGGRVGGEVHVTRLMIGENSRTTINLHAEGTTPLTELERNIILSTSMTEPDAPDPRAFRTLLGSNRLLRAGGTINRTLFGNKSSTLDAQLEHSNGRALLGPSIVDPGTPLERDTESLSGRVGIALSGDQGRWRWSLTGAYDFARNLTLTDREDATALTARRDRARSTARTGELDLVANGPLVMLPAGRATATLRVGASTRDLASRASRDLALTESDLGRDRLSASMNVDLPIARRDLALSALGNVTLNLNAAIEELSDFGTLRTLGGGVYLSPSPPLNLIASLTREEAAPGLQQLGDPLLVTPAARIFDFRRGGTVLVEAVTGGNPDLTFDTRKVIKLGGTYRPSMGTNLQLRADYVRTRIDDPVARFPGPTGAVEAAFPERFVRDISGELLSVDLRPVNFDSSEREELRWGFNFTKPLRSRRPPQSLLDRFRRARQGSSDVKPRERRDGAGDGQRAEGGRGGGRGGFGGGGQRGGRLQLSIFHTLLLSDEVRIRPGLPVLDYLGGEAAEGGSGRSRHRIEAEAGWFNNGLGARLTADWQSGSEVRGGPSGDLAFEPLARFNLRLFANLGEQFDLVAKYPWLRGTQVRLSMDNILDAKQRVRDATGLIPNNYQPDLIDSRGRTISISVRKLFMPPRSTARANQQR
jgi:hypothetical protein